MNENGIVIVEQLREFWHGFEKPIVRFAFGIISIGDRHPNPFHACRVSHVAVLLCALTFFEQRDQMRAAHLTQDWKVDAARTMIHGKSSFADRDKFDV